MAGMMRSISTEHDGHAWRDAKERTLLHVEINVKCKNLNFGYLSQYRSTKAQTSLRCADSPEPSLLATHKEWM